MCVRIDRTLLSPHDKMLLKQASAPLLSSQCTFMGHASWAPVGAGAWIFSIPFLDGESCAPRHGNSSNRTFGLLLQPTRPSFHSLVVNARHVPESVTATSFHTGRRVVTDMTWRCSSTVLRASCEFRLPTPRSTCRNGLQANAAHESSSLVMWLDQTIEAKKNTRLDGTVCNSK